ncbi:MAG TPA: hypothetical protein VGG39_19770 [Polyangiaceae bacterium]
MRTLPCFVTVASFLVVSAVTFAARATPRPLPFTYTYDTLAEGETEIEQYVDLVPLKGLDATTSRPVWYTASQLQTEFEHGITDHLELGLYIAIQPDMSGAVSEQATLTEGTGFKERLKYRLADAGDWPVDVALYGELVEYSNEFEIEAKVILERRFGNLRIAANAWAEREWYYAVPQQDWVLNPTAGATYQFTPAFHLGVEYWMRVEFPHPAPDPRPFSLGPHQFVGPAVMFDFGHLWWSTGVYARLDDVNRVAQPLDDYGPIWVRTVVGLEL